MIFNLGKFTDSIVYFIQFPSTVLSPPQMTVPSKEHLGSETLKTLLHSELVQAIRNETIVADFDNER